MAEIVAKNFKKIYNADMAEPLEAAVAKLLINRKMTIAAAESCTGGLVSNRLTNIPGSSKYFMAGIVAYSNSSKENILGVSRKLIERYGAVSRQVALEMAIGIKYLACADIGIGITGIAGPSGGTMAKPVGLVYIAIAVGKKKSVKEFRFKGSREEIRFQASQAALNLIRQSISPVIARRMMIDCFPTKQSLKARLLRASPSQ